MIKTLSGLEPTQSDPDPQAAVYCRPSGQNICVLCSSCIWQQDPSCLAAPQLTLLVALPVTQAHQEAQQVGKTSWHLPCASLLQLSNVLQAYAVHPHHLLTSCTCCAVQPLPLIASLTTQGCCQLPHPLASPYLSWYTCQQPSVVRTHSDLINL